MSKKVKALEMENEFLQAKLETHGFVFFLIGIVLGSVLVMLSKDKKVLSKLKEKMSSDVEVDEETMEVLEEEKDNFE